MVTILTKEDLDDVLKLVDNLTKRVVELEHKVNLLNSRDENVEQHSWTEPESLNQMTRSILWNPSISADDYIFTRIGNEVTNISQDEIESWKSQGTPWIFKNIYLTYATDEDKQLERDLMRKYNLEGHKYRLNILMRKSSEFRNKLIQFLDLFIEDHSYYVVDNCESTDTHSKFSCMKNTHEKVELPIIQVIETIPEFRERYMCCRKALGEYLCGSTLNATNEMSLILQQVYEELYITYGWVRDQSQKEFRNKIGRKPESTVELLSVDETFGEIFLNLLEEFTDRYIECNRNNDNENNSCPM